MNTRKAFRMLIVALFFIFVSLISRSIIYLVLSVAIATIIIFLLSSNKKVGKVDNVKQQMDMIEIKNKRFALFLWIMLVVGAMVLGYGSLFFTENTFFHQFLPLPEQLLVAILLTVLGFCLVLGSLYFLIRESLNVNAQTVISCEHCGARNNHSHLYCHSCGEKIR